MKCEERKERRKEVRVKGRKRSVEGKENKRREGCGR